MVFRDMQPRDITASFAVRTAARENRASIEGLRRAGITEESVAAMLASTHRGWVCEMDGRVVGFSMGNASNGEFWVVAVLPEYEGRGIGRKLTELVQEWLWSAGHAELWLWTSPDTSTRAYQLYRKLGWTDCGVEEGRRILKRRRRPTS